MKEIADPVAALVAYLRSQSEFADLVGAEHIYGDSLPSQAGMPRKAVTIRHAGGGGRELYLPIIRPRLEVRCYGETDREASRVFWALYSILNGQCNLIANDTRLMSVLFDAGPSALQDETLNTPFKLGYLEVISQQELVTT